jgi:hypothetical protein
LLQWFLFLVFLFLFFFWYYWGLRLEPFHQPFVLWWIFFKIGSHELIAQAGFKLRSSWSLPSWVARIAGMSHQCLADSISFDYLCFLLC